MSKISWTLISYRSVLYEMEKGGGFKAVIVQIEATITLLLRDMDVALLLKAMQSYTPDNENEVQGRAYLLEVLEQVALPEDTRNWLFSTIAIFYPSFKGTGLIISG